MASKVQPVGSCCRRFNDEESQYAKAVRVEREQMNSTNYIHRDVIPLHYAGEQKVAIANKTPARNACCRVFDDGVENYTAFATTTTTTTTREINLERQKKAEAARLKQEAEAEAKRKKKEAEAEAKRKKKEEEKLKEAAEAEAKRKKKEEEKLKEEEEKRLKEEAHRKKKEEERLKEEAEAEAKRKKKEEEKLKEAAEAEAKRKKKEEERIKEEEEKLLKEEAHRKKKEEEAERKRAKEEALRKKKEEEAAAAPMVSIITTKETVEDQRRGILDALKHYNEEIKALMLASTNDDSILVRAGTAKPFIGVAIGETSSTKILADTVFDGSPAYVIGMRPGDEIVSIGGIEIDSLDDVRRAVKEKCRCGSIVIMKVRKVGEEAPYEAVLWLMTTDVAHAGEPYYFDMSQHTKLERRRSSLVTRNN